MYEDSSEMIGERPLFRQKTRCHIMRVIICYCRLSTSIHHRMALFNHAWENLLLHSQVYWSIRKDKSRQLEGDYHGQTRTTWFLWKEGVNCQILKTVYV